MKALFIVALFCSAYNNRIILADHTELCKTLKDGTQLLHPDSCNQYITCQNQTGRIYSCATPNMYDRNKYKCVDTIADCRTNYCAGVNGKWIANPNNCHGFFYCSNNVAFPGDCTAGYHFDESRQLCVFDSTSGCNLVPNICDFLPDKTKLRDENDCTVYYECSKGKKTKKTCKNTYFDVDKGDCVDKALVDCKTHPKPPNVCGTEKSPAVGFKTDAATCRGYFYCKNLGIVPDLEPIWGQCPEGMFFNSKKSTCVDPTDVYCIYNRCDGRGNRMVISSRNNCHNYIICENGRELEEKTCNGDRFFDEYAQACVPYVTAYPCCDGRK